MFKNRSRCALTAAWSACHRSSLQKLQDSGIVLTNLRGVKVGALFGDTVWRLAPMRGTELPFHRFAQGTSVIISTPQG